MSIDRKTRSQKLKVIALCVVYNILLELWAHGFAGFINPVFLISVSIMYTSYFLILEDLIVRCNYKDHHILLLGFVYGMFQETFNTGSVFNAPQFLSLNFLNIFIINVLWWGLMQSLFAHYFAWQIVKKFQKNIQLKKMDKLGWIFAVGFNALFLISGIIEGNLPDAPIHSFIICVGIMILPILFLIFSKKRVDHSILSKIKIVDVIIVIQCILAILIGILLNPVVGYEGSALLFVNWSLFLGLVYAILRIKRITILKTNDKS